MSRLSHDNSPVRHYRPDVDGLRAVAIIPVVLYHAGVPGLTGGFVGVDVFFVISGYVIASLIGRELAEGRFSFAGFYERRIRRLYPAFFVTLAVTTILAALLLVPPHFEAFSESALAAVSFLSNVWFWKNAGYFEADSRLVPLLHTWSLAVEEQFYIVMPLVLWAVHRFARRRFALVLVPAAAFSFALSVYATSAAPSASFFLLPTRAWELLLGAVLALSPPTTPGRRVRDGLGLLGLGLVAVAVVAYGEDTPFPGLAALLPCLGAALVIHAGPDGVVGRLLSLRPLVAIGLVSYSLYLVHWPLIVFLRYATMRDPTAVEIVAVVLLSLVLAGISWRFVETPFRRPRPGGRRGPVFASAVSAMAVGLLVGAIGVITQGLPARMPGYATEEIAIHDGWRKETCFLLPETPVESWRADACFRTRGNGPELLVWGDSYAAQWMPGVEALGGRIRHDVLQYTMAGCPPILAFSMKTRPYCSTFAEQALSIVRERHIETVVLAGYWPSARLRGLDRLPETIAALKAAGARDVVVIGQSPYFATDVQSLAYRVGFAATDPAVAWSHVVDRDLRAAVREAAAGATYVDPLPVLCPDDACPIKEGGRFLYSDDGHASVVGSIRAAALTFPFVEADPSVAAAETPAATGAVSSVR